MLHCASFSKCLAPGYRVGWAAPGRFAQAVARQKLTTTLGASAPVQLALATYLERGGFDKHLRRLRQPVAQMAFVRGQVDAADPAALEAQLAGQRLDAHGERSDIHMRTGGGGHGPV